MRKAQLSVNLWLADGQIRAVGYVADATPDGASIIMANPVPVGLEVELEFLTPEQPWPRAHGTVVWSEVEKMWVQLHDLAASDLQALQHLLGSDANGTGGVGENKSMIGKKRVYELAKEFGLESQEALSLLQAADIPARSCMSSVYEDEGRAALRKTISSPSADRPGMQIIRKGKKT